MRARAYLRQSQDRHDDAKAVARQRKLVKEAIARRGWELDGEYVDNDVSATKSKPRPGFVRAINDATQGDFDVLVAVDLDRLTRKPREVLDLIELYEDKGFASVTLDGVDFTTDSGQLQAQLMGAIARQEVKRKTERQQRELRQRAEAGRWSGPSRGFGHQRQCEYDKCTHDVDLHVVKSEAKAIREVVDRLLAGESLRSITQLMADRGVMAARTSGDKRPAAPMTHQAWRQILLSLRISARVKHESFKGYREGRWPAIIDAETHDKVLALLGDVTRNTNRGSRDRKYLLSGFVTCGDCGGNMTAQPEKAHDRVVYRCRPDLPSHCGRQTASMTAVDALVLSELFAALRSDEFVQDMNRADGVDELLVAELAEVEEELKQLTARKKAKRIDLATFFELYDDAEARRAEADKQLQRQSARAAQRLNGDPEEVFSAAALAEQRTFIGMYVEEVTIVKAKHTGPRFNPDRVKITWRI